jgi:hypothetical protein
MLSPRLEWQIEHNFSNCDFFLAIPFIAPLIAEIGADIGIAGLGASLIGGVSGASLIAGVGLGAAQGALLGGLTGGGKGAELGALTGGISGAAAPFGPALGSALGIGAVGGDILAGAGSALLGAEITGQNPLTAAATGAVSGGIGGLAAGIGGNAPTSGAASPGGVGPGTSPATVSTPAPALSGAAGSAPAFGDISSMTQGGSVWGGPGSTITSSPLSAPSGAISGGGTGGGTISGPGGGGGIGSTITGPTAPDLSINQTPEAQSAQLGNLMTSMAPTGADADVTGPSQGMFGKLGDWVADNPLKAAGIALGAGGLLMNMFSKNQEQADTSQLQSAATGASTMARAAEAPLFSGVLPPGAQAVLDTSKANQTAAVRSAYSSMGMGGGTGQAEALEVVDQNVAAQQFAMEDELFQQAGGFSQVASSDDIALISAQRQQDQDFSNALAKFVAALGGGKSGSTVPA